MKGDEGNRCSTYFDSRGQTEINNIGLFWMVLVDKASQGGWHLGLLKVLVFGLQGG